MSELDPILIKLDQAIIQSRLNAFGLMLSSDRSQRLATVAQALQQLRPGAHLLGTGPSTVGIVPLSVDEVVLGRAATPLEEPTDVVVDCAVADTLYFAPQEVSRTHAKIVRRSSDEFLVVDLGSTCGTFVNGERVDPESEGYPLSHGDVLSLGSAQVSTYLFWQIRSRS